MAFFTRGEGILAPLLARANPENPKQDGLIDLDKEGGAAAACPWQLRPTENQLPA